jgi:hypothetical protein
MRESMAEMLYWLHGMLEVQGTRNDLQHKKEGFEAGAKLILVSHVVLPIAGPMSGRSRMTKRRGQGGELPDTVASAARCRSIIIEHEKA